MRIFPWLCAVLLTALMGCGVDAAREESTDPQEEAAGTLQLALRGVDADMQPYRLRNATFDVQGVRFTDFAQVSSTLSSESDLDSPTLRSRLVEGNYSISLRPDSWYLERITPDGAERVTQALLLSSAQQSLFVQQGQVSRVGFQFGIDGELVDFRGGEVEIAIDVQRPQDAGVVAVP